jgi:hypothetical protein
MPCFVVAPASPDTLSVVKNQHERPFQKQVVNMANFQKVGLNVAKSEFQNPIF